MDQDEYDKLMEQEDYYRKKYGCIIYLKLSTAPDTQHNTGKELHTAVMTITGETYIVKDSPVFRSDENGAFYRQTDAMLNTSTKLVAWFKDMEARGFMSYNDEYAFITGRGLQDGRFRVVQSEAQNYMNWLLMRRREFTVIE
ncbi:hypothetical protein DSL72_004134 [Monilinia vaccinii-corymbosi]|uniref:Uncharacterized protein n=1 Tax=Monilinia vaccinii-corymbosi TaxID=61207 RepID=A0A8A3P6Z3_9HELO|nr:hypothetical protein DSL72_004134 [Monilinia vaccinii-corymbosi]